VIGVEARGDELVFSRVEGEERVWEGEVIRKLKEVDIAVSAATLWEMILKNRKGKLPLPDTPLHQEVEAQGFRLLSITPIHLEALRGLDIPH
jgi:PIN domain nuclease of toxin-antitoxin system